MSRVSRFATFALLVIWASACQRDAVGPLAAPQFNRPAPPPPPPADPAIVFVSSGLSVMNADGSNQTVILQATKTTTIAVALPSWSPDAKSIVFAASINGVGGLWIVDVAVVNGTPVGSNVRQLQIGLPAGSSVGAGPAWSPLGDAIAVVASSAQWDRNIYGVPPTGGVATVLYTSGSGFIPEWPAWSPDASKLVFVESSIDTGGVSVRRSLLVFDRTTQQVDTILSLGSFFPRYPAWSHGGGQIAYSGINGTNPEAIYTVPFTGTITPTATSVQLVNGRDPTWSPDDSKIAFAVVSGRTAGIYALTLTSSVSQQITQGGSQPNWRRF